MPINTQDYVSAAERRLGPLAEQWKEVPHRLVYDLVKEIERMDSIIVKLVEALEDSNQYLCSILEDNEVAIADRLEIQDRIRENEVAIKLAEGK